MIDKKRLLRQFALPTDQRQAFIAVWRRQQDLFGDGFELVAQVDAQGINLVYTHVCQQEGTRKIWSMIVGTGLTGRAKIEQSIGIQPPVTTLHRAAAIVAHAIQHLQANPGVTALIAPPDMATKSRISPKTL